MSRAEQVAVLLDRRADPGARLELKLNSVPLAAAMRDLARTRKLGVAWVGPVAYFGPLEVAARIRTLAALAVVLVVEKGRLFQPHGFKV